MPFTYSSFIHSINMDWVSTVTGSVFVIDAGTEAVLVLLEFAYLRQASGWRFHAWGHFSWFTPCYSLCLLVQFYNSGHWRLPLKTVSKLQLPEPTRSMSSSCFLGGTVLVTFGLLPLGVGARCDLDDRLGSCRVAAWSLWSWDGLFTDTEICSLLSSWVALDFLIAPSLARSCGQLGIPAPHMFPFFPAPSASFNPPASQALPT